MQGSAGLIYLGILVLAFYLLIIRPQMQRSKQMRELLAALSLGDKVVTIGGMHGTIVEMTDNTVTLRVTDGVEVDFDKSAIGQRLAPEGAVESEVEVETETVSDEEKNDD